MLAIIIFVSVAIAVLTRAWLKKQTDQHPRSPRPQLSLLHACCCFPSGEEKLVS